MVQFAKLSAKEDQVQFQRYYKKNFMLSKLNIRKLINMNDCRLPNFFQISCICSSMKPDQCRWLPHSHGSKFFDFKYVIFYY